MSAVTVTFTHEEVRLVTAAIRTAIKKAEKGRRSLVRTFGDEADLSNPEARIVLLESAYRKMGKAPERMAHRESAR